jgi:hypothetical protein
MKLGESTPRVRKAVIKGNGGYLICLKAFFVTT